MKMKKIFSAVLVSGVAQAALAGPILKPWVVYGEDDRKEIYQVQDPLLRDVARSAALVIETDKLHAINDVEYSVDGESYGEQYHLCADEPFREQKVSGFCSAFLVAPNKIATAGHCVETASECAHTSFVFGFGYDTQDRDLRSVSKNSVYSCKRIIERKMQYNGADYALIEIDREAEGIVPMKLAGEAPNNGDVLEVIGHPAGIPSKIGEGLVRSNFNKDYLLTTLDTYGGNSGSAVLRKSDHAVVGILVRGEEDFMYRGGCRVSNRCTETGCRGEDVTRINYISQALSKPH
jgi:hypothetical protein